MHKIGQLLEKMTKYYGADPKRCQHFIKVYTYAKWIGEAEHMNKEQLQILESAALVHDIGIKVSEEKYHSSAGKYQELEGPQLAEKMLAELGFEESLIRRVSFLVGHHHTYIDIQGIDYQILVEADFLVNFYEDQVPENGILQAYKNIFRTDAGRRLCREMYQIEG